MQAGVSTPALTEQEAQRLVRRKSLREPSLLWAYVWELDRHAEQRQRPWSRHGPSLRATADASERDDPMQSPLTDLQARHLMKLVAETSAWCTHQADANDPANSLRALRPRPGLLLSRE